MALKRKITIDADGVPQKRSRIAAGEDADLGEQSDDSGDYKVNYTDNGKVRAESEARRQWNYVCNVCDQRFNRPCRLETHIRSHNRERPFACTEIGCDKTFPRKDHLQRHLKNAHKDPVITRTFTCDWQGCGKSFTSNGRLQRHRDVHESKFYCTEHPPCNESFRKEKALNAHVKTQHLEVKPYPCTFVDPETGDRCTSAYQAEGALQRHVYKIHSADQENGIFCMLCVDPARGMDAPPSETGDFVENPMEMPAFASQEELMAHVHLHHPPECTECGQRFKSDANLKSHFDAVHTSPSQQSRYRCPEPDCDSVFNRKHNLAVHIQTVHEKRANYICAPAALVASKHPDLASWPGTNACGAAFKAKSSLDQHVRTHHLGLGNRKQLRKAAKSKKKPQPSMLSMLTGVGYEKSRDIPCLVLDCTFRFYMDRDLRRHLRAAHALPEDDIEERIRERDALAGGAFWIGGIEDGGGGVLDSADPSMPQTPAAPYFVEPGSKAGDGAGFFDQRFGELALLGDEEAELDLAMGLGGEGDAGWAGLRPVERFNMFEEM